MKRLFAAGAILAALAIPASAQDANQALTPGHLPAGIVPTHYEITVTPDAAHMTLAGTVSIAINVAAPTREIVVNALELTFDHVDLDGGRTAPRVTFNEADETAHILFAQPISAGQHALNISYHGKIYRAAQGMFAVDYDAHGTQERALYTQFEAADARRFVPCMDEPILKAIFQINVIAPEGRMVVSNMPAAGVDRMAGGLQRTRFQPTPKMSSYLMFVGVGDFERITTNVDGVEIGVVTKRGSTEAGRFALTSAADILRYYNDYFGVRYPLPKLDMIAGTGGGGFGAMENWGAIFYFERAILVDPAVSSEANRQGSFNVVAHEMAHQWFGDLVTMAWWDDIWLNEGFASWMQAKAAEHYHPDWNIWLQSQAGRQQALVQDARATTHPIVQHIETVAQANLAFDRISYQKGQAVIRMVETYVGADAFRDGVRAYMQAHQYNNARTSDLWDAVEHASAEPMRRIADEFTHQPGVPLITVEPGQCRRSVREITLRQSRFGTDEASRAPLRWHVPVAAAFVGRAGRAGSITDDAGVAHLSLADCGPYVINPGQTSYYRVAYPRAAFQQLAVSFSRVDAMDQYGLLADARALGETDISPYTDFFDLARNTPADADPIIWSLIAAGLGGTDTLYEGRPNEEAYREYARSLLDPVFANVGWTKKNGEADNVSVLRERLIETLGELEDSDVVSDARERFNDNNLPGAIRAATLNVVGANADAAMFNALLQRGRATTGTLEKTQYYMALAHAHDPAIAEQALAHAFDEDLNASLGPRMIQQVSQRHPEMAWRFAAAHQAELAARLDPLQAVQFMPGLVDSSNDPAMLTTLRQYIDASVPAGVRRSAEEAYLQLQQRLHVRETKLPQLDTWLRAHNPQRRAEQRSQGGGQH